MEWEERRQAQRPDHAGRSQGEAGRLPHLYARPGPGGSAGEGEAADIGGNAPVHEQRGEHGTHDAGGKDRP